MTAKAGAQHEPGRKAWPLRAHLILVALASAAAMWLIVAGLAIAVQHTMRLEEQDNTRADLERARALLAKRAVRDRDRVVEYAMWDEAYRRMAAKPDTGGPTWFHNNFEVWFPSHYGDRLIGIWDSRRERKFLFDQDTAVVVAVVDREVGSLLPARPAARHRRAGLGGQASRISSAPP